MARCRGKRGWPGPWFSGPGPAGEGGVCGTTCGRFKRVRRGGGRGRSRARRVVSLVGAVVVSALLLGVLGFGYGGIPALGPALDPGRGAWTSADDGAPATSQALHVPGLAKPVPVSF